jgi:hypothetical protein
MRKLFNYALNGLVSFGTAAAIDQHPRPVRFGD